MGRSQKWPDLRSPISIIQDIRFVGTDDLIKLRKFHNFPWNIVAVARLASYFVVGSLGLTWWPDLAPPWVDIFTKFAKNMGSGGWKPGGAARHRIFAILDKPERGGGAFKRHLAGHGLKTGYNVHTHSVIFNKVLLLMAGEERMRASSRQKGNAPKKVRNLCPNKTWLWRGGCDA